MSQVSLVVSYQRPSECQNLTIKEMLCLIIKKWNPKYKTLQVLGYGNKVYIIILNCVIKNVFIDFDVPNLMIIGICML